MIFLRVIFVISLLLGTVSESHADPLNFMVGPFTFIRPTKWTWKDPDPGTKAAAELQILDAANQTESQVLFSFSSSKPDDIMTRWKSYFAEPPPVDWQMTTNRVQSVTVTYLTVTGTQRSKKKESRPDYSLLGAIIITEKGTVYGRVLGPRKMVQRLTDEFKKMVETAVAEN